MMDFTPLVVAVILFAAAYLQSATGFGLALVCMAFVPLVLPVTDAIIYVSIASFFVNFFVVFANRSGFSWRRAIPLSLGMALGIPLGYFGLRALDGEWVVRLLGVVLMSIAVTEFLQKRFIRFHLPEKTGGFFGFFGGILAGSFNVGGPPVVVFAYSMRWSKVETVAVLQTVFIIGGLVRNILMFQAGEYYADILRLVAWSLPASAFAVWLGKITLDRLPQASLKAFVFVLIFLIGLRYALFG
jgi:uncharacterized protein